MHREFNYVYIRHLLFPLELYLHTIISTTSLQLAFCRNSILQTCGTNSGMSSSSELELQVPNAYRIELSVN